MSLKVEKISEVCPLLGEGPHWDERQQALFFIDVFDNSVHKFDYATRKHTSTKLEASPSFVVPVEGQENQFVMALGRRFAVVEWDGAEGSPARLVRVLAEVDPGTGNKINDGKVDPKGRLYAGTMAAFESWETFELYKGTLYRLGESGITALTDRVSLSNGLDWDVAARAMYYIDTFEGNIRRYDYDVDTGDISNMRYIFDFKEHGVEGRPDGCTVDTDGNLWVAAFEGGCVVQVSPAGKLLRKVPLPAKQVTSCTFGGPALDILFVTTGRVKINEDDDYTFPAGCTYQITGLGVKGHPNRNFKLSAFKQK